MKKISQLDYLLLPSTLMRLLLWLLSLVLVMATIVAWVINSQRITFDIDSNDAMYNINEQLLINDAALAGFGSILASVGPNNLDPARNFTKHMRDTYPHIYMFEALVSVDPANKTKHEVQMRGLGYPGYKVTRYVSKKNPSGKAANLVNGVPMHFPIFFIVLGLGRSSCFSALQAERGWAWLQLNQGIRHHRRDDGVRVFKRWLGRNVDHKNRYYAGARG